MPGRNVYQRDAVRLAAALALTLFAVFAPFLTGSRTLLLSARDVASLYPTGASPARRPDGSDNSLARVQRTADYVAGWLDEPSLAIEHRLLFEEHVLPMWDPFDAYGTPFAASMQTQPFYPLTALLSIAPNPVTYDWFIVMRLYIAGFGAALFARLFAGARAAFAAGVTAAFAGYSMIYFAMPHLSVETLLPMLLFAVELALRRASPARAALLSAVAACTILGGMPESAVLAWLMAAAYAALRIVMMRSDRRVFARASAIAGAACVAIAVSAITVLPFLEDLTTAFDSHQSHNVGGEIVGLRSDPCSPRPQCLPPLAAPLAYGPPWNDLRAGFTGLNGVQSGYGIVTVWLAAVALAGARSTLRRRRLTAISALVFFLAATVLLLEAKRFGVWPAQWIGVLPVLRLIFTYKYGEAIVATCLAVLAAFGVSALGRAWRRGSSYAFADVFALVFAAAACAIGARTIPPTADHAVYLYGSLAFAVACFGAALGVQAAVRSGVLARRAGLTAVVAVVALQAAGAYAIPMLYLAAPPVPSSLNPYSAPAYVRTIRENLRDGERVFSSQTALRPEWPAAFGLPGISIESALWTRWYVRFARAFSPGLIGFNQGSELDLDAPLTPRLFRLSSVRFVIAPRHTPLPDRGGLLAKFWAQNASLGRTLPPGAFSMRVERIGDRAEPALVERAPQSAITPVMTATPDAELRVEAGIAPSAYRAPSCAAAVRFTAAAERDGRPVISVSRVLDPQRRVADRRWSPMALPLRRVALQPFVLRLTTEPDSRDACHAFSEWGHPRIVHSRNDQPLEGTFATVEDHAVHIMRFSAPMPRANVFRDVRSAHGDDEAMAVVTAPDTDVARTAVVDAADATALPRFAACSGKDRLMPRFPRADRVEIDADLACAGLVMLNDTWYPGWHAWVDGKDVPVIRTDVLFRGITLTAGRHRIAFVYAPRSVALGTAISLIGLMAWLALVAAAFIRRRRPKRTSIHGDH